MYIYTHNFNKMMTNIFLFKISCLKKSYRILFTFISIIHFYFVNLIIISTFQLMILFSPSPSLHAFSVNARRNRRFPLPVERSTNYPLASPLTNPETFPKDFYDSWWPVSFSSSSSFPSSLETCPYRALLFGSTLSRVILFLKNIDIVRNAQWFADNCVRITKKADRWQMIIG